MTELQIGLIGLGGAAVAAVLGYNKWQEYRQRKLADQLLKTSASDVLLDSVEPGENPEGELADDEREPAFAAAPLEREPALADADPVAAEPGARLEPSLGEAPALRVEPTLGAVPAEPAAELAPSLPPQTQAPAPRRAAPSDGAAAAQAPVATPRPLDELKEVGEPLHLLSPQIDYIAAFDAVEAVPATHILGAPRAALARVRKAVYWIGYNEPAHEWEVLVDDGQSQYRHFRAGLQLVDRRGPLNDADLTQFHGAMQDLADQLAAIVDLPARRPALEGAAKLDGFCAGVDIQIGINVVAQAQPFTGTKLRALAESAGMVLDREGRFVRCDDDGNVLYMLLNQDAAGFPAEAMRNMATGGVTFLLDVPRVAHGERVFNQMVELARRFADVLRGTLVDDNRRPLSEPALEPIRRQVAEFQALMAAQGLPAGGLLARRLFS